MEEHREQRHNGEGGDQKSNPNISKTTFPALDKVFSTTFFNPSFPKNTPFAAPRATPSSLPRSFATETPNFYKPTRSAVNTRSWLTGQTTFGDNSPPTSSEILRGTSFSGSSSHESPGHQSQPSKNSSVSAISVCPSSASPPNAPSNSDPPLQSLSKYESVAPKSITKYRKSSDEVSRFAQKPVSPGSKATQLTKVLDDTRFLDIIRSSESSSADISELSEDSDSPSIGTSRLLINSILGTDTAFAESLFVPSYGVEEFTLLFMTEPGSAVSLIPQKLTCLLPTNYLPEYSYAERKRQYVKQLAMSFQIENLPVWGIQSGGAVAITKMGRGIALFPDEQVPVLYSAFRSYVDEEDDLLATGSGVQDASTKMVADGFDPQVFSVSTLRVNQPVILRYMLRGTREALRHFSMGVGKRRRDAAKVLHGILGEAVGSAPLAPDFNSLATDFFSGNEVREEYEDPADNNITNVASKKYTISYDTSDYSDVLRSQPLENKHLLTFLQDVCLANQLEKACSSKTQLDNIKVYRHETHANLVKSLKTVTSSNSKVTSLVESLQETIRAHGMSVSEFTDPKDREDIEKAVTGRYNALTLVTLANSLERSRDTSSLECGPAVEANTSVETQSPRNFVFYDDDTDSLLYESTKSEIGGKIGSKESVLVEETRVVRQNKSSNSAKKSKRRAKKSKSAAVSGANASSMGCIESTATVNKGNSEVTETPKLADSKSKVETSRKEAETTIAATVDATAKIECSKEPAGDSGVAEPLLNDKHSQRPKKAHSKKPTKKSKSNQKKLSTSDTSTKLLVPENPAIEKSMQSPSIPAKVTGSVETELLVVADLGDSLPIITSQNDGWVEVKPKGKGSAPIVPTQTSTDAGAKPKGTSTRRPPIPHVLSQKATQAQSSTQTPKQPPPRAVSSVSQSSQNSVVVHANDQNEATSKAEGDSARKLRVFDLEEYPAIPSSSLTTSSSPKGSVKGHTPKTWSSGTNPQSGSMTSRIQNTVEQCHANEKSNNVIQQARSTSSPYKGKSNQGPRAPKTKNSKVNSTSSDSSSQSKPPSSNRNDPSETQNSVGMSLENVTPSKDAKVELECDNLVQETNLAGSVETARDVVIAATDNNIITDESIILVGPILKSVSSKTGTGTMIDEDDGYEHSTVINKASTKHSDEVPDLNDERHNESQNFPPGSIDWATDLMSPTKFRDGRRRASVSFITSLDSDDDSSYHEPSRVGSNRSRGNSFPAKLLHFGDLPIYRLVSVGNEAAPEVSAPANSNDQLRDTASIEPHFELTAAIRPQEGPEENNSLYGSDQGQNEGVATNTISVQEFEASTEQNFSVAQSSQYSHDIQASESTYDVYPQTHSVLSPNSPSGSTSSSLAISGTDNSPPNAAFYQCYFCSGNFFNTAQNPHLFCLGCGPNSIVRYCSTACLLADSYSHTMHCAKHASSERLVPQFTFPPQYPRDQYPLPTLELFEPSSAKLRQKAFSMHCYTGEFPAILSAWANTYPSSVTGQVDLDESSKRTGDYHIFRSVDNVLEPHAEVIFTIILRRGDHWKTALNRTLNTAFVSNDARVVDFLFRFLRYLISDKEFFQSMPATKDTQATILEEFHRQFTEEFGQNVMVRVHEPQDFDFDSEWPLVEHHLNQLEPRVPELGNWLRI